MQMEFFRYDSPAFRNFLKDHPHERGEVKFLESIVQKGMNIIDIGANTGITTVVIAEKIGKEVSSILLSRSLSISISWRKI